VDERVQIEIEALRTMKVRELQERYRELFGEVSHSSNRAHLFRRLAWRLQALAEGDLSERARQRASELADDLHLRLRAPRPFWRSDGRMGPEVPRRLPRDARLPPPDTVVRRRYRDKLIEVTVLEHGFAYQGQRFGSLSLIAQRVTGTRWNGFHFFGLKGEWKHD
jgi:Protein of unknown function (DUF2924)